MDPITNALLKEFVSQNGLSELPQDEQFEHFAAYCVISSRYTEDFNTEDVVTGGGADLGIDSFAVIVNGRLVDDADSVSDLVEMNGYLDVEFVLIQAKRSSSFDGAAIIALGDNLKNAVFSEESSIPINDEIKLLKEIKDRIYTSAAKLKGNPECRVYYVTTGNWADDKYLKTIIDRKISDLMATNLFKSVKIEPIGAGQLQKLYRETRSSIARDITFNKFIVLPDISKVKASYLGAIPATEFVKLITDDDGNILKSIFVDNVRDFQGENPVNKDISDTITKGALDQFALRNNGVTIVSRDIKTTGDKFTLKDYQIVNGCQTSHVLFAQRDKLTADLYVPLKLIHTEDEEITQQVIKSTNRQTPVDENDLLALTLFQRGLEDFYSGFSGDHRLFYERRSKQYASKSDIEKGRIIPIGIQLKCFAAMFLGVAHQAGRYQGTLLKAVNESVFKADHRPDPYYTSAFASYRFEVMLRRLVGTEREIRPFKFHILAAFRHRFEASDVPDFANKKVAIYCDELNVVLWDIVACKKAFDLCCDIVRTAAANKGLSLERDSAKIRDLTEEVRQVARSSNPRHQG